MKRAFDLVVAFVALIVLAPWMAAIALAVKLGDGGPILFCQTRVGRFGKPFRIYKFRTMVVNAERLGLQVTAAGDPRITSVGRWLRKTKLDELPQLFNVIKGEMSLVGPRPEVPRYAALYDAEQRRVLELRPGITDPASIAFLDESNLLASSRDPERMYCEVIIPAKIEINLRYARRQSWTSDLSIIAQTFVKIITLRIGQPRELFSVPNATNPSSLRGAGSLTRDVVLLTLALTVYSACQLGMLVVFAQIGSPDALGQFVLGLAVTAPVVMLSSLQLRVALATDVQRKHRFSEYFGLRCAMSAIAVVMIVVVAMGGLRDQATTWTILSLGCAKICESFSDLYFGRMQRDGEIGIIAQSLLIKGPLTLLVVLTAFSVTGSVPASCSAIAVCWLAILLAHDVPLSSARSRIEVATPIHSMRDVRNSLPNLTRLFWSVAPLGLAIGIASFEANIPRYIVEVRLGRYQLGIYGAIACLAIVSQPMMNAMCHSCLSRLAQLHAAGDIRSLRRLALSIVGIVTILGASAVLTMLVFGRQIVNLVFGADFANERMLLVLVTSATAVNLINAVLVTVIKSTGRFRIVLLAQIASAVATASGCWWAAEPFGLVGIGAAILAVAVFNMMLLCSLIVPVLSRTEATRKELQAAAA